MPKLLIKSYEQLRIKKAELWLKIKQPYKCLTTFNII